MNNSDFTIENNTLIKYFGNDDHIIVPDGITVIGEKAFYHSSAKKITLPDSVKRIEIHAFLHCKNLESVDMPESLEYLGGAAFFGCGSLTGIVIPEGVTKLYGRTFTDCSCLRYVTFPDSFSDMSAWEGDVYDLLENSEREKVVLTLRGSKRVIEMLKTRPHWLGYVYVKYEVIKK